MRVEESGKELKEIELKANGEMEVSEKGNWRKTWPKMELDSNMRRVQKSKAETLFYKNDIQIPDKSSTK